MGKKRKRKLTGTPKPAGWYQDGATGSACNGSDPIMPADGAGPRSRGLGLVCARGRYGVGPASPEQMETGRKLAKRVAVRLGRRAEVMDDLTPGEQAELGSLPPAAREPMFAEAVAAKAAAHGYMAARRYGWSARPGPRFSDKPLAAVRSATILENAGRHVSRLANTVPPVPARRRRGQRRADGERARRVERAALDSQFGPYFDQRRASSVEVPADGSKVIYHFPTGKSRTWWS